MPAQSHRDRLVAELTARVDRERTLARAERELELQRLLMAKGAKSQLLGKRKRAPTDGTPGDEGSDDEFRGEGPAKSKLPAPEEGVATKARVWVRSTRVGYCFGTDDAHRNGRRSEGGKGEEVLFTTWSLRTHCTATRHASPHRLGSK
jgi:hypothetical protein